MYDEDDDEEDLDETEVEKWRNYEQMNPQPTGPLMNLLHLWSALFVA